MRIPLSPRLLTLLALPLTVVVASAAPEVRVEPTRPPSLAVVVDGREQLALEPVVVRDEVLEGDKAKIPMDYNPKGAGWSAWKQKNPPISLVPALDTLMLGNLHQQVVVDSVSVESPNGRQSFTPGEDFLVNETTGQVINLDGGLGEPGSGTLRVSYRVATQRIDLVQADQNGRFSVKTGEPAIVCPMIPEPDPGNRPVAGVFVSPYPVSQGLPAVVTADDIFPIEAFEPVAPINPEAISGTLRALEAGEDVAIGFVGDSITLGAEAGQWWSDRSKTYTGRVLAGLKERYPRTTVSDIPGWKGGGTTQQALPMLKSDVLPKKPDLVLIALGINDATGGKGPRNPPDSFERDLRAMIEASRASGAEVMLVTSMVPVHMSAVPRIGEYRQVMLDLADEMGVACADVQADWKNLAKRGIPPFSQIHNCSNHPGEFGMIVYADTILRFFE